MMHLVLMGVAGCGKSSVGAALSMATGLPYRDGDDLHPPGNIAKMRRGDPLTDTDRWPWLDLIGQALGQGPIIIGCSALKRNYRDFITQKAGRPVGFVHLSGSRAVIEARMAARKGHFMPTALLDSQFATLEPPAADENAAVVQIDQSLDGVVSDILAAVQRLKIRPQSPNSPPRKPPTMADVALATGVSLMTVSRAFKQDASILHATRAAILQTAEGLGYVFDATASTLRSQRTNFVAVIIPSINNANFADTVGGLTEGLKPQGLQILLGCTNYDIQEEERLIEQLLRRRPEAIVVTGGIHTARARRLLANAAIPVIETWDLPSAPIGHVVGFSNAMAVRGMVDHFVAVGYTKIAFIGGDADRDTRGAERRLGFIAAMQMHGLDATRLISAENPPISMREGAQAMAHLLSRLPDTEAVICVSDLCGFGALTECQRRGVMVPDQMAIGGFGNYDIAAICMPSLTTINPDARGIGARAAALILDVLDGKQTNPVQIALVPALIVRQSSL